MGLDVDELVTTLAPLVLPYLAAAAHGPILLHLLPRTAPRSVAAASMARSTIRELARHPTWTLTWLDEIGPRGRRPLSSDDKHQAALAAQLAERLSAPELRHQPASTSIQPTMAAVDQSGLAAQLLGDLAPATTVRTSRRTLLRLAAQSMLQDPPEHAPYGWSHCLTMPQAALSVARHLEQPASAVAVRSDPVHEQLFRAAAAYLNVWWSQADTTSDS